MQASVPQTTEEGSTSDHIKVPLRCFRFIADEDVKVPLRRRSSTLKDNHSFNGLHLLTQELSLLLLLPNPPGRPL